MCIFVYRDVATFLVLSLCFLVLLKGGSGVQQPPSDRGEVWTVNHPSPLPGSFLYGAKRF